MNKPFLEAIAKHFKKHPDFFLIGPIDAPSGAVVPIYPDLKKLYSDWEAMAIITQEIAKLFKKMLIEVVAGVQTGGIPIAMAVSLKTKLPFVYVKKEPEKLTKNFVVGIYHSGQRAVLLDDVMGRGSFKKLLIYNALKSGLIVKDIICLCDSYYKEPKERKWFFKNGIRIKTLINRDQIFKYLNKKGLISDEIVKINSLYLNNPLSWHKNKDNWQKFLAYKEKSGLKFGEPII